ncbi:tRNA (adenosine(37)-N6)-threonylcarbamoyltransferase complex dimerization subunit type 1 TsaB [Novosphingobium sp. B1]|uniref:tRNA (adenosine(37)-N6)-threonylcarbamoyltransferase complex dimerization subunit type 1 TsaB n=1 Tax=Novosphingobium sp. B1 TaxID=1938756 RepID=UPI0009D7A3E0|nr:tRNA (adenosine(37)-N6)-threonylcarbamoyltransferase complex dimerization subunit type 1 TsaB [Novosphingobium sp. B1]SMC50498.1 tRNA threonylcarbamoyl adenosine modification protein YeaZ [Novosphingobium sp. B1]
MRTLVIDSATEACSVALLENAVVLASDNQMLGRGHAERLVPMIAALPDKGRAERILVDVGPGSFTGIRVGLATARALALAWGAQVMGFESLSLVAAMALSETAADTIDVCMTGGHGEWFLRSFASDATPISPLASLSPAAAVAASNASLVAGSQAAALGAGRMEESPGITICNLWPDARFAVLLGASALIAQPRPIYGRAPDARLPATR